MEGVALMKALAGEYDRAFTLARLAEVRRLLDTADALGDGVDVPPMPSWHFQKEQGTGNGDVRVRSAGA